MAHAGIAARGCAGPSASDGPARPARVHAFDPFGVETGAERWDYNVQRVQIAGGYRLASNAEVRAEYLTQATAGPVDPDDDVIAHQLWWAF